MYDVSTCAACGSCCLRFVVERAVQLENENPCESFPFATAGDLGQIHFHPLALATLTTDM